MGAPEGSHWNSPSFHCCDKRWQSLVRIHRSQGCYCFDVKAQRLGSLLVERPIKIARFVIQMCVWFVGPLDQFSIPIHADADRAADWLNRDFRLLAPGMG